MEPVRDYELRAFFTHVVQALEDLEIAYMVVGGFAATLYGEPRLTIDVDIVADLRADHIRPLLAAFPEPDYYASEEAMRDALQRRYPFNIIQPTTGAKVDLVLLPRDPFTRLAFQRRQRLVYDEAGHSAMVMGPEDVVVAKLIAHRQTGSDKHLRDARGVLVMQWGELNLETMRRAARASDIGETFEELLEAARRAVER